MTKLGSIDFDKRILDAIRDDKLVVFAGAGVSMGPPSNLPSFWRLASDIAQGTGQDVIEPLDRFLGTLQHSGVTVHERAAQFLAPEGSAPTPLHHDLLRLFRAPDRVRLVTTNFDLHFETAAHTLFGVSPEVYRAPVLPLGYNFTGIVHVHGALPHVHDCVLTDADFGRAYLIDGWARRFLVDMFRQFTVLFVGYSHQDVVMNYLARALSPGDVADRFALTDTREGWGLLGIHPILFPAGDYQKLNDSVHRLAGWAARGALDWKSRLSELGRGVPPAGDEDVGEIEHALNDATLTRYLTEAAQDVEWLRWLHARHHLRGLFGTDILSQRDEVLASWIVAQFVISQAEAVFEVIAGHGLKLQPQFWWHIGRELGLNREKVLKVPDLKRWVSILLATVPDNGDHYVLPWLAEQCAEQGEVSLVLNVFFFMTEYHLEFKPRLIWPDQVEQADRRLPDIDCLLRADYWKLNEIWSKHIKPNTGLLAQSLLSGMVHRLEAMHGELGMWGKASREWDPVSFRRSAIEPHEQDRYPEAADVLIDAARDTLQWFAENTLPQLDGWLERLVTADAPVLRRLAIHAMAGHPGKSANERLQWLLDRVGLHNPSEHHEVYQLAKLNYAAADETVRQAMVAAVLAEQRPAIEGWTAEQRTARLHFNWLSWLVQAKPDCALAKAALAPITAIYPLLEPNEYPDFTHWMSGSTGEIVASLSPWTVEYLLAHTPCEQLDDMLNFQGQWYETPNRDGMLVAVLDACKQRTDWACGLAAALAERQLWTSDLWSAVIQGLQQSAPDLEGWRALLTLCSCSDLLAAQVHGIANLLHAIVKDGGQPCALDLLTQADEMAVQLWQLLQVHEIEPDMDSWTARALNHPAGVLVQFWINSLSLQMRDKVGADRVLPEHYRERFTMVVEDATLKGDLGRCLLASQTAYLLSLDEVWTKQHLIPMFSAADSQAFTQAWEGFLTWGRLTTALAEVMLPAFLGGVARLGVLPSDRQHRFIEYYSELVIFHIEDPWSQLLPALFQGGGLEARTGFAAYLEHYLRGAQADGKRRLWAAWLHGYWQKRLQGIPAPLEEGEIKGMLEWLIHCGEHYPEAALLASQAPAIRIDHSYSIHQLQKSELVICHPVETAELLIYLCSCEVSSIIAGCIKAVAKRLPLLEPTMQYRLDDALARLG